MHNIRWNIFVHRILWISYEMSERLLWWIIWAMSRENLSSGDCDQVRLKPACSAYLYVGSDQTAWMLRLMCFFTVRICHKTGFLMMWLNYIYIHFYFVWVLQDYFAHFEPSIVPDTRGPLVLHRSPECIGYAEQAWKYMTISCINFHPCRSIRKQIWLSKKNGQRQPSVIILINLVVL